MNRVTELLGAIEAGDPKAADELLPLVYDELRRLAARRLAQEKPGQTLQVTALVHEAYIRLIGPDGGSSPHWNGAGHYFAAAAEAMRRILVENARRKHRLCHGGDRRRVDFERLDVADPRGSGDLLALDDALATLASEEPEVVEVVKLRYFAGLTIEQTAAALDISVRTVNRHWAYAKAWLFQRLSRSN